MPPFRLIPCLLTAPLLMPAMPRASRCRPRRRRPALVPDLVTAYGTAAPALDGGMTLSLQQDGRVLAIAVTPGETVHAGERLLDLARLPPPSPPISRQ